MTGCTAILGHGLESLRESSVVKRMDLVIAKPAHREEPFQLSEDEILPILDGIIARPGCSLQYLQLPPNRDNGYSIHGRQFAMRYTEYRKGRGHVIHAQENTVTTATKQKPFVVHGVGITATTPTGTETRDIVESAPLLRNVKDVGTVPADVVIVFIYINVQSAAKSAVMDVHLMSTNGVGPYPSPNILFLKTYPFLAPENFLEEMKLASFVAVSSAAALLLILLRCFLDDDFGILVMGGSSSFFVATSSDVLSIDSFLLFFFEEFFDALGVFATASSSSFFVVTSSPSMESFLFFFLDDIFFFFGVSSVATTSLASSAAFCFFNAFASGVTGAIFLFSCLLPPSFFLSSSLLSCCCSSFFANIIICSNSSGVLLYMGKATLEDVLMEMERTLDHLRGTL
ncbi:hypothetical protein ACHAXR_005563, partial [Thalassiosira sp. AJA248-18]